MQLTFDPGWLMAVLLGSVRTTVLFMMSPVFTGLQGFVTLRVLLSIALAVLLAGAAAPTGLGELSAAALALATVGELMIGMVLAFGVMAAFGAFAVAGNILDVQIGLGMGNVYDPVTRKGGPLFGSLLNLLGLAVFFALDGHHVLLRGLAYSIEHVPLGQGWRALASDAILAQFALMFSLGVALIAPVLLCLLLLEAGLAVVSRMLPQMNVFVLSMPLKTLAGLALLALTLPAFGDPMARIYGSIFTFWQGVLG